MFLPPSTIYNLIITKIFNLKDAITIYKQIGLHRTNFIGVSILSLGYFLMYLSTNLFMDMSAMILGGIGTGIILYPSTTNTYEWFKEHNGIIVGIMETMVSLGSFFFAFLGEKIINNKEIPSNDEDNLYDISIGKRIKKYLIVQITSLISVFFLFLYMPLSLQYLSTLL